MNFGKKNHLGRSDLLVKEVILPKGKDEAETSHNSQRCSDYGEEQIVGHSVQIGDHEVKPVRSLKHLEKKPLENYFGGTKPKKQTKRKSKTRKLVYNPNSFDCTVQESNKTDMPTIHSDSSTEEITEDMVENNQLQLKIYKYQKMKEYNEQKIHIQQRMAEENYLEEMENLAETWEEYKKRRHQLEKLGNFPCPRYPSKRSPSIYNGMGFSILSRKYWKDSDETVSDPREYKTDEVKKAGEATDQHQSNYGELGEELIQKLVFVYDDDSDGPPS